MIVQGPGISWQYESGIPVADQNNGAVLNTYCPQVGLRVFLNNLIASPTWNPYPPTSGQVAFVGNILTPPLPAASIDVQVNLLQGRGQGQVSVAQMPNAANVRAHCAPNY